MASFDLRVGAQAGIEVSRTRIGRVAPGTEVENGDAAVPDNR